MEIIKLNLIPSGVNPTCHCSQYDNGRVIRIDLFDGLTPYVLQSGDTVTLNVRKPDNTIIEASLTATQGNTYVNLVTTEQMCACVGYNLCDLTITNGSVEIGTLNFIMQVERDVLADGIPSQSVIEDLDALVQEAVGDNYYTKSEVYNKTEIDDALANKASASEVENIRVGADGITYDSAGNAVRNQLNKLKTKTTNIFNMACFETTGFTRNPDGSYQGTGQAFTDAFQQGVSGLIFDPNTQYTFSAKIYTDGNASTAANNGLVISFWDSNNTRIGRLNILNSTTSETQFALTSTANKSIAYITITSSSAPLNIWHIKDVKVDKTFNMLKFVPYETANDIIARQALRWKGKKIVTFGDSRTWYDKHNYTENTKSEWTGKTCIGYQEYIRELLQATVDNQGFSGYTSIQICQQIVAFDFAGYDAVFLEGGVNDFINASQVTIGEIAPIGSTFDTNTVYGAWQNAIEYILNNYPSVKIYMDIPAIAWVDNNVFPYNTAKIKGEIAELYNIPCFDLYKKGGINELNRDYWYADDVSATTWRLHFNDYGNQLIGEKLAQFINNN